MGIQNWDVGVGRRSDRPVEGVVGQVGLGEQETQEGVVGVLREDRIGFVWSRLSRFGSGRCVARRLLERLIDEWYEGSQTGRKAGIIESYEQVIRSTKRQEECAFHTTCEGILNITSGFGGR